VGNQLVQGNLMIMLHGVLGSGLDPITVVMFSTRLIVRGCPIVSVAL
jgi:hypothetical protein